MSKLEAIVERLFLRGSAFAVALRIAALVALIPVLFALPIIGRNAKHRDAQRTPASSAPAGATSQSSAAIATRPLYPYSVIPGGAYSPAELKNAIALDPVVANHYVGFDVAKVRVIHLDRDEMEYVSYRIGERVYWTKRKLLIRKGEALLSDGTHEARTRCGNRLSDHAVKPTSAAQPLPAALETAEPTFAPTPDLIAGNYLPDATPTVGPPVLPTPGGFIGSLVPPVYGPIVGGGPTPQVTPTPPGPPVATPEPGSLLLLASGVGSILAFARRRKDRA